jgi:hypothetical protein
MEGFSELTFDDVTSSAAVLRLYRQVFAVLARQGEAMILDPALLDVDEAILESFADGGSEGMTIEQVRNACRRFPESIVDRRFEVLRDYGAINKAVDRANERRHRAAFAPYVMLLFLRRVAAQGGQSELHQLLTLEHMSVQADSAVVEDGLATLRRLTQVFRLLANELAILSVGGAVEQLRDNAQLLWGNRELIGRAEKVHEVVLGRWPQLDRDCAGLRMALAAYGDAIDAAAGRLLERAGTTRALGLLPVETWKSFARKSDENRLAGVLDSFLFDAPAPWFDPQELTEAVASGPRTVAVRVPPPRPEGDTAAPVPLDRSDDAQRIREIAEEALSGCDAVSVVAVLESAGDWAASRRILAVLTAAHHHPDLPYELVWGDGLRIDPAAYPSWVSQGWFRRAAEAVHAA